MEITLVGIAVVLLLAAIFVSHFRKESDEEQEAREIAESHGKELKAELVTGNSTFRRLLETSTKFETMEGKRFIKTIVRIESDSTYPMGGLKSHVDEFDENFIRKHAKHHFRIKTVLQGRNV